MSDREPVLRDCFKVKKGLCVTGDAYITGNLTLSGDFAWMNPDALLTVGNIETINLSAGRLYSSNDELVVVPLGPDYTIIHPLSVVDETVFESAVQMEEDLWVKGNLRVDGNAYLSAGVDGVINVGDNDTDNVVFNADIQSSLIPDATDTYDLGSVDQHWDTLYVHDISAHGSVDIEDNLFVSGTTTLSGALSAGSDATLSNNLTVSANTTIGGTTTLSGALSAGSDVEIDGIAIFNDDVSIKGDLRVDGNAYLSAGASGSINIGDTNTDNIVFVADVSSNILPDDNITFDLGSATQQWKELHTRDVSISQDLSSNRHVNFPNLSAGELSGNFVSIQSDGELTTSSISVDVTNQVNTVVSETSGDWNSVYTDVSETSADWNSVYASVTATSADWNSVYASVTATSGDWDSVYTDVSETSGDWDSVYAYINSTSATNSPGYNDTRFVNITGDTMTGTLNIEDTLSATGSVTFDSDLLVQGDLRVDGDVWFNATNSGGTNTINLGDNNTDNIIFNADIDSNFIPNQDLVFDLGSISQRWGELFVNDISASGDTNVNDISITGEIRNPSSVWSPSDLPDINLISWHDAADVSTINVNAGTTIVTSIDDKSTNSYNLTKEGTGFDITTGSTVNMLNSVSAVEGASLTNSSVPLPEDHAFYIVARVDTTDNGSDSLLSVKTGNSWQLDAAGATIFEARLLTTGLGFDSTTHKLAPGGGLNNQLALIRLTFNGSTDTVTGGLNGLNKFTQASYTDKQSPAEIRLFGNRSNSVFPDGVFSEMLIVSDVTQSTQDKVEGYLAHKWGLTLDSAHTYASVTPTNNTPPVVVASSLSWPGGDSTQSNDTTAIVQSNSATWSNQPTIQAMTRSSLQITTPYGPTGELIDWTPTNSTVNVSGWWDASDESTLTIQNTNEVTQWADKSTENYDLSVLNSSATGPLTGRTLNGLRVLEWNNTNPAVVGTVMERAAFNWDQQNIEMNAYMVIHFDDEGALDDQDFLLEGSSNTSNRLFARVSSSGSIQVSSMTSAAGVISEGNTYIITLTVNGSNSLIRVNGVQVASGSTNNNPMVELNIGANTVQKRGLDGFIAEIVMTDDRTSTELIEGYLAHKWGLSSSLDSGHQYSQSTPQYPVQDYNPEFLTMQSDSSVSDSKWTDINYEHAMVLPYDATVKRVVLRGTSTQGATINVSVHSNRSETNPNDVSYKFFPNTPIETKSQSFTTNNEGRLYTFLDTTSASMGRTIGLSLSADQVIGHTNATIVLQYDT
jgi:cytoskeletal protein CcmA (bactofilin family)